MQELCDDQDSQDVPEMPKRGDLSVVRGFEAVRLGASKEAIKEEYLIEASYSKEYAKVKRDRLVERRAQS